MSIVNSIETVRDWLTAEVCPLVKLKLPDDNATDASYPYKLVNPAAFSLFVPSKDRTPPNIAAPIPMMNSEAEVISVSISESCIT